MSLSVEAASMFMGLGIPDKLTDSDFITDPLAVAISADGSTIVGTVRATLHGVPGVSIDPVATRWTQATGQHFIALPPIDGAPNNDFPRVALDVSTNGSIIVGRADGLRFFKHNEATDTTTFFDNALRIQDIGGISADGNTIVGTAAQVASNNVAFRLTGTDFQNLEKLPLPTGVVGNASATAVSPDGSLTVGFVPTGAALWNGNGVPLVAPTVDLGAASDLTPDGSVVIGATASGAFKWNTATNTVEMLETIFDFPDREAAVAVSADGSRIVGNSGGRVGFGGQAVLWDENNQIHNIRNLLSEIGLGPSISGWDIDSVVDISADGRTIIGNGTNPAGQDEPWIAVIEEIPVVLPDPTVFWTGENGDSLWHSDIGGQTNWAGNEEDSAPPPGGDGTGVAGIFGDDVTLNGTPPGQTVTSIAALNAEGTLTLNAPLSIGGLSGAENVTINSDLTVESKLILSGTNAWRSGTASGGSANVASGKSAVVLDGANTTLVIESGDKSLDTNLTLKNSSGVNSQ